MRSWRRAAVAAVGFTLGAAVVVAPSWAVAEPARPDAVNSANDAAPGQAVAKDAQGRTLVYVEGAQEKELRDAVAAAGGVVHDADAGRVKASVPGDKLDVVAGKPGVAEVRLPDRAIPMGVTSDGVRLSQANQWIAAGKRGAGVKVGIIDVGFGMLTNAQDNGELPANIAVNDSNCVDATAKSTHGTAVAEIVHDMAPDAQLFLACVEDTVSFSAGAEWLKQQGVQVITAAVGFLSPVSGRGDGTGETADSPAEVVRRSRESGILWSVAAGNQARLHFAGKAVDVNGDKWVEFQGSTQNNLFAVDPGKSGTVAVRWDAWPTTKQDLDVFVTSTQGAPENDNDPRIVAKSTRSQQGSSNGLSPTEELTFVNNTEPAVKRSYWVYVRNNNAPFTTPFEMFVGGTGVTSDSQLTAWTTAGSVTEPATSPYAMAVGASAVNSGTLETFSGRGPTIDGRMKPDIIGFDKGATSTISVLQGTSAAAAHVAGAAALLKSANPALDAAQLQAALESRTSPRKADNDWGKGLLNLGAPDAVPTFEGSGYTALPIPQRIFGGGTPLAAGETRAHGFPTVPGDTTAVAVTVHGRADVDTTLEVSANDPNGPARAPITVQVRGGQVFTGLTVFVPLGPDRSIKVRNKNGTAWYVVEYLGYFSPSQSTDLFTAKPTPERVFDTRGFVGTRTAPLAAGNTVEVPVRGVAGVPANATSVVLNVHGFESTGESYLVAYGATLPGLTTVSVAPGDRRANLTVVPIADDGKIRVHNPGYGQAGVAVDVVGWFAPGAGARYVALPSASRLADTDTGTGLPKQPIGHGRSAAVKVAGVGGVSSSARYAALTVTGTEDYLGTELTVTTAERPWSPVVNTTSRKMEAMAGLALVPLGASGKVDVRNERGQTRMSLDVSGYFVGEPVTAPPVTNCAHPTDDTGFTAAFDGRAESDLAGWLNTGTKRIKREGCELVTDSGLDATWYAARTYNNDYTLKFDWNQQTANSDSGVLLLFSHPTGGAVSGGIEVNIGPQSATGTLKTGGIVGRQAPLITWPVAPNQWNTFEITVGWNMVTVLLNGIKVNEIVVPEGGYARNSFFGFQNNGDNDPVRFRNVRVKRNTPVKSGTFVGVNNRCLDIYNGDPTQSVVQMWTCHGGFSELWTTTADGAILGGGRCLAVENGGSASGAIVRIQQCAGHDSEQWIFRQDGRIVNPRGGKCLTPTSGEQAAWLHLQDCSSSRADQVWQVPSHRGRGGNVRGPGGLCLDLFNNEPRDHKAVLWTCNHSVAQIWSTVGDGTLRAGGKCLDVTGAGTGEGNPVALWDCWGGANNESQKWQGMPDGTVVNPISGRCLTSSSTDAGATLLLSTCTGSDRQRWRLTAESTVRGSLIGYGGKCLDVVGDNPSRNDLWYWTCYGPGGQLFTSLGDTAFRAYGKCLDIGSTNNEQPVSLASCQGQTSQLWSTRHDGTVVNVLANRCLDVRGGNTGDGATVQIFDCHRGPAQRWAITAKAS